jgi:ATP-binding cassette subfamily B protein
MKKTVQFILEIQKILDKKTWIKVKLFYLAVLLSAIFEPIVLVLYKNLLNMLSNQVAFASTIFWVVFGYEFVQLLSGFSMLLIGHEKLKLEYTLNNILIKAVHNKLNRICEEEFEKENTYNLLERVKESFVNSVLSIIDGLIGGATQIIQCVGCVLIVTRINLYLGLAMILANIPYIIVNIVYNIKEYKIKQKCSLKKRQVSYYEEQLQYRRNAKDIRLFNATPYMLNRIENLKTDITKEYVMLYNKEVWLKSATTILKFVVTGLCIILCIKPTYYGTANCGDIVVLITASLNLENKIFELFENYYLIMNCGFIIEDWYSFSELPEEKEIKSNDTIENYSITFRNVSFKYAGTNRYALQGVNLHIKQGEKIVIIGENGSGKTTFINLLLGCFSSYTGNILIDGKEICNVYDEIRRNCSVVFQDFLKLQLSIKDNIFLEQSSLFEEKQIEEQVYFIGNLKNGINTVLGQLEEGGIELSGGEWQLIAILRAMVKTNKKIIVMDEPTSYLDSKKEDWFYTTLLEIPKDMTVIIVSHRLSVAKLCDRIVLFKKGRIETMGTHEELIENSEEYKRMYFSQKDMYDINS